MFPSRANKMLAMCLQEEEVSEPVILTEALLNECQWLVDGIECNREDSQRIVVAAEEDVVQTTEEIVGLEESEIEINGFVTINIESSSILKPASLVTEEDNEIYNNINCTVDLLESEEENSSITQHQDEGSKFNNVNEGNESAQNDSMTYSKDTECVITEEENTSDNGTRKRKREPNAWSNRQRKIKRNRGEEYVALSGQTVPGREMKPLCTEKCRLKCYLRIEENMRLEIHKGFWKLGDITRQREFLVSLIEKIDHQRNEDNKNYDQTGRGGKRKFACRYFLIFLGTKEQVCKTTFLNTFGVSERYIYTSLEKLDENGFLGVDERGKHGSHSKTSTTIINGIREHIKLFPTIESHYLRAQTRRQYLDGNLTIAEMYRMYVIKCKEDQNVHGKKHVYDKIFNTEFNLGFFKPKKDLCVLCEEYKIADDDGKSKMLERYTQHVNSKVKPREEKKKDIELASHENSMTVVCDYDLQAILPTPCGDVSTFYYKRRLNVYNFTIFDNVLKNGYCYMWDESNGNKGANEIATSVFKFLKQEYVRGKHIIFYSDNCAAQNKNKFLAAMYMYAVHNCKLVSSITHKYFLTGHTQNAGDAMHSCIERQKKRMLNSGPIYVPNQWATIVRCAKKTGVPYSVEEMGWPEFYDFKRLVKDIGSNYVKNENGNTIKWTEIKVLKVDMEHKYSLLCKTSFEDEYEVINVRGRARGTPRSISIHQAFKSRPGITSAKKTDLLSMCKGCIIPTIHHDFFYALPVSATKSTPEDIENL